MKRILLVLAALIGACAPSNALFLRGGGTVSSGVGEAGTPPPLPQGNGPVNMTAPTITGMAMVGGKLTAINGEWTGSLTSYTRQWSRNGTPISGATGATYSVVAADLGATISVCVTAVSADGSTLATSSPTAAITLPPAPVNTASPAIAGTPIVGTTLMASNGTWTSPVPITYTYQWYRGTKAVRGATFYPLGSNDLANGISVTVTGTNAGGSNTATSATTSAVVTPATPANTVAPAIVGRAVVGYTLIAAPGSWSRPISQYIYQWIRVSSGVSSAIIGAIGQAYVLESADLNDTITVSVKAANGGGTSTAVTSAATATVVNPPTLAGGACGGWASKTFADGCAFAPTVNNYTIQHSDFFTGSFARQSGQTWGNVGGNTGCKNPNCHPPWAVAAVDYPVGPSCSTADCGFGNPGGPTDPTISSNYANGNPGGCVKAGNNQIVCNGPTSQEVDIGPFDFSWKGNSYGVGMGLTLGTGLTGPCVVHDSYFLWDMGSSSNSIGAGTYSFTGCSSLTIKNSVFRIRNPKTGQLDALWNGATQGYIQIHVGAGPRSRAPGEFNSPLILEYDAIINCPERCFTTGTLSSEHNYFQGINMKDSTAYAAHGDGWLTTFYNGPTGPSAAQICNCTGLDTLMEKFDTWMTPNYGAGSTSCITCAMVNVPGPAVTATIDTRAPNVAHVTSISGTTFVAAGSAINSRNVASNYTYPGPLPQTMPRIAGCPGNDCAAVDPASCTSATPCDYTLNVNWPNACSPCSWGLLYPSNTITADYENNVYATNIVNATGAAPRFCTGPGCSMVGNVWWAGYGTFQNVIVKNNYVDLCGVNYVSSTGPPHYNCTPPASPGPSQNSWFGSSAPELSAIESGNVMMTNGGYFKVFMKQNSIRRQSPKGSLTNLLLAPARLPAGRRPQHQERH